jgi:DNA-directed RNA polymerase specialized sigma24 family protein
MSANLIALLHAAVEPPGLPPLAPSEPAPGDVGEDPSAAQADSTPVESAEAEQTQTDLSDTETAGAGLAQENPTAMAEEAALLPDTQVPSRDPDLWLYRDRTVALLRRYLRLSIEVGRMPSLLGREFFRTRVTSYKASTFEDSVIFVHDVERSLEELNEFEKKLIAKIVLQQYSKEEAGRLLGCGYRTVERLFPETLDRVSKILLRREILTGLPNTKREVPKTCQEGKRGHFLAND